MNSDPARRHTRVLAADAAGVAEAAAILRAGGLVAASRGIVYAHERIGGTPEEAAAREAARLRELAWGLST